MTGLKLRQSTLQAPKATPEWARSGRRFLNRGLWLHARVIPAAFPSGKTGHISRAVDANLEVNGMDLDKRRPQAPGVEAGITGFPERGDQPQKPDHARRPRPARAGSGGNGFNRGAGFALGTSWLGHRFPLARTLARDAGPGTAHCPLKRTCRELRYDR